MMEYVTFALDSLSRIVLEEALPSKYGTDKTMIDCQWFKAKILQKGIVPKLWFCILDRVS